KISCVFTDQRKDHTKWHKSHNISQKISCYSHNAQLLSICPESSDFLEEHQVVVIFSFCAIQASEPVRKKKKINQRKNIQHKQNCPCCLNFLLCLSIQFSDLFYLYKSLSDLSRQFLFFHVKQAAPETGSL